MQKLLVFLLLGSIFVSCSKVDISEVSIQRIRLAGTGNPGDVFHTWRLDSAILNGKPVALTSFQKSFKKTYFFTRDYNDTDLYQGKWDITEVNKLKQFIYLKNSVDSTTYDILKITAFDLQIKTSNGTSSLVYYFKISN
jgi:hypothetical protein